MSKSVTSQQVSAAAIYARISADRYHDRLGVARQEQDCRALAERRGWPVATVYIDNDVSAFRGARRPEYTRLLRDLKNGVVDALIVWHPDRLHRSVRELEEFIDLIESTCASVATVQAGDYDLSTANGRTYARMGAVMARLESEHKSERVRRKAEELAMAGKVGGGGDRPFGYERDRITVREDEAQLIREAAAHLLAGRSIGSLLRSWHERGIKSVRGNTWRTSSLRRMITSPRIAGLRQFQGELLRVNGEPVKAQWPAIITPAEYERLAALIADPVRKLGGHPRTYLLTGGLGVCGLCGHRLYARPHADRRRAYICYHDPHIGMEGCGRIRSLAEPLEEFVRDVVLAALDGPALREELRARESDDRYAELLDSLRRDEESLARLQRDFYEDHLIDRSRFLETNSRLRDRLEATRRALARRPSTGVLDGLPTGEAALRAVWDSHDMQWRRSLLDAVLKTVVLNPAVKGRNFFDPNRVEYRWKA